MLLLPIYSGVDLKPAFCLRYSWSGWPAAHVAFDNLCGPEILDDVTALWEKDGLRLLEYKWSSEKIQLTFSTTPDVSPVFLASRAKGRLQYALRKAGYPSEFQPKTVGAVDRRQYGRASGSLYYKTNAQGTIRRSRVRKEDAGVYRYRSQG